MFGVVYSGMDQRQNSALRKWSNGNTILCDDLLPAEMANKCGEFQSSIISELMNAVLLDWWNGDYVDNSVVRRRRIVTLRARDRFS